MTMNRARYCALAVLIAAVLSPLVAGAESVASKDAASLGVLSFNVKVDIEVDATCPPWDERKGLCLKVVKDANPDLIGLQENSSNQLNFFKTSLPDYSVVGPVPLSAEDLEYFKKNLPQLIGKMELKEFDDAVLLYRTALFEKLDEGHWWLSPTPEKLSNGFGNIVPRLLIWAKLKHKPSGRVFIAAVTHFDNSMPSQSKMAVLAHEKLKPFVDAKLPVLFWGDFNTDQGRGDYPKLTSDGWKDSYVVCPQASKDGKDDNVSTAGRRSRIDHIFYQGDALIPKEWKRLESPDPTKALSDHFPVFARFELR